MPLVRLSDEDDPTPNLAPMIDVILVLTIFFMCATKFSGDERQFELDLPEVGGAAVVDSARPEIVEVEADGALRLGPDEVSLDPARRGRDDPRRAGGAPRADGGDLRGLPGGGRATRRNLRSHRSGHHPKVSGPPCTPRESPWRCWRRRRPSA